MLSVAYQQYGIACTISHTRSPPMHIPAHKVAPAQDRTQEADSQCTCVPVKVREGAVRVLKPDLRRPCNQYLYLLRAEGMRPVVKNELNLGVWLAFRQQGRTPSLFVLPARHFGVQSKARPVCPPCWSPSHSPPQSVWVFRNASRGPQDLGGCTNRLLGSVV